MPQRYVIVAITAVAALWMYIDRVCFATLAEPMKAELLLPVAPEPGPDDTLSDDDRAAAKKRKLKALGENPPPGSEELTAEEITAAKKKKWADRRMSKVLGAFFLTYALFQIPMGTLADRYGARAVLALSIAAWSLVTMLTGFVPTVAALLVIRLLLGVTEAGAYPAAAGLVKRWAKPEERGRCSSIVALGGRIGGAVAPWLTALLATGLVGLALVEWAIAVQSVTPAGEKPTNWRGVFVVYGLCGLAVAALFWLVVRDRPPAALISPSPLAGEGGGASPPGEGALSKAVPRSSSDASPSPLTRLEDSPPSPTRGEGENKAAGPLRLLPMLARSRNMWLFGALQFGVNLGWVFIVTLLPTYLKDVFDTPVETVGSMQTTALTIGLLGMVFGGVFTDWLRQKLGPKRGRSVPIAVTLSGCACVFFAVPGLPSAWAIVFALGVMAFCVDMHNPSIWSFAQDVGGKNVGAALGWGNMWGNLGAAVSPLLLTEIRYAAGWNAAFLCCGAAFACSALCGLLLDATKPVDAADAA
jgi:MFS family permease